MLKLFLQPDAVLPPPDGIHVFDHHFEDGHPVMHYFTAGMPPGSVGR